MSAVTGSLLPGVSPREAGEQARRLVDADVGRVVGRYYDDQWIVTQKFNPYRPFYRVDLKDPAGSHVYVSALTGEALQVTTHVQRIANDAGSIVHWIYPTILRRYPNAWSYTVWCISLVGIVLGCYRSWSSLRNARKPGISPFRRLFRLHHVLGLGAGFFLLTWIFSGWLSVDHGILFPTGNPTAAEVDAFRGEALEDAGRQVTLLRAAHAAWPSSRPAAAAITAQDDYAHLLYDGLPADALRLKLRDTAGTWVHVSASTGQIIDVQDWRRRLYRWLFNGLHTFDIPGLSRHDLLRKLVMLPLLTAGFLLSLTGIILAKRRLSRRAVVTSSPYI